MNLLLITVLLLIALVGTAVVLTRHQIHQVIILGLYGILLGLLFLLLHAPGVALAQGIVSGLVLPLLVLLAVAKTRDVDQEGSEERS